MAVGSVQQRWGLGHRLNAVTGAQAWQGSAGDLGAESWVGAMQGWCWLVGGAEGARDLGAEQGAGVQAYRAAAGDLGVGSIGSGEEKGEGWGEDAE
ncbi:hypothetical protein SLEP1_g27723 [Rubroshorea leprosula]|uniref:Uncharacterized protein n=1 Tax=Rubroshorea leprosula TaxID=152421 RepID=A0AAV5JU18_9ROSI|nr:hypothetical protein SLEP1_g27723 [Rubroshorea leprosula]